MTEQDSTSGKTPESEIESMLVSMMVERLNHEDVKKAIEKKVDKLLLDTVDEVFFSYNSVHKKKIIERVSGAIDNKFYDGLSSISLAMGQIVMGAMDKHIHKLAGTAIDEEIFKSLEFVDTGKIELQDILNEYIRELTEANCICGGDDAIHLFIEAEPFGDSYERGESLFIGMSEYKDVRSSCRFGSQNQPSNARDCDIFIHLSKHKDSDNEYHIVSTRYEGDRSTSKFMPTALHGLSRYLFKIYGLGINLHVPSFYSEDYELIAGGDR